MKSFIKASIMVLLPVLILLCGGGTSHFNNNEVHLGLSLASQVAAVEELTATNLYDPTQQDELVDSFVNVSQDAEQQHLSIPLVEVEEENLPHRMLSSSSSSSSGSSSDVTDEDPGLEMGLNEIVSVDHIEYTDDDGNLVRANIVKSGMKNANGDETFVLLVNGDEAIAEVEDSTHARDEWLVKYHDTKSRKKSDENIFIRVKKNGAAGNRRLGELAAEDHNIRKLFLTQQSERSNWNGAIIPYVISPGFFTIVIQHIDSAISHWHQNVPVRFVPKESYHTSYINIVPTQGSCWSYVGQQGNAQNLGLDVLGACGFGATVHEFGHALSQWHEQSRPDRDTYVDIDFNNIDPNNAYNYGKKTNVNTRSIGEYDYGSIMHYGPKGFAIDYSKNAMTPRAGPLNNYIASHPDDSEYIGQRIGLSTIDIYQQTKEYFKCTGLPQKPGNEYTGQAEWYPSPWKPWTISGATNTCTNVRSRIVSCVESKSTNSINADTCLSNSSCNASSKPVVSENYSFIQNNANDVFKITFEEEDSLISQVKSQGGDAKQFDWAYWKGAAPNTNTGPSGGDHTGNGFYMYPVLRDVSVGDEASIKSFAIDMEGTSSGKCTVLFWYHFKGVFSTKTNLKASLIGCNDETLTSLWNVPRESSNQWKKVSLSIPPMNRNFMLKFTMTYGGTSREMFGIDDIEFQGCVSETISTTTTTIPTTVPTTTITIPPVQQTKTLFSTLNYDYRSKGHMFDVVAKNDVEITSLDVHIGHPKGEKVWVAVYTKDGSYKKNLKKKKWMYACGVVVVSQGEGNLTAIPSSCFEKRNKDMSIKKGEGRSFYVTLGKKNNDNLMLSAQGKWGVDHASNEDLDIVRGVSLMNLFKNPTYNRIWNGKLHYTTK